MRKYNYSTFYFLISKIYCIVPPAAVFDDALLHRTEVSLIRFAACSIVATWIEVYESEPHFHWAFRYPKSRFADCIEISFQIFHYLKPNKIPKIINQGMKIIFGQMMTFRFDCCEEFSKLNFIDEELVSNVKYDKNIQFSDTPLHRKLVWHQNKTGTPKFFPF